MMVILCIMNGMKTTNLGDRLNLLEQYIGGHAKQLVNHCLHLPAEEGYLKARELLKEYFGNEQKITNAYMKKAFAWSVI